MNKEEPIRPAKVYRLWESARDLVSYSDWLPEVVGTPGELMRIGTVLVDSIPETNEVASEAEPLKFIDADVTKYRNLLSVFRKRHESSLKNK